jgi:hypothetical protein
LKCDPKGLNGTLNTPVSIPALCIALIVVPLVTTVGVVVVVAVVVVVKAPQM